MISGIIHGETDHMDVWILDLARVSICLPLKKTKIPSILYTFKKITELHVAGSKSGTNPLVRTTDHTVIRSRFERIYSRIKMVVKILWRSILTVQLCCMRCAYDKLTAWLVSCKSNLVGLIYTLRFGLKVYRKQIAYDKLVPCKSVLTEHR